MAASYLAVNGKGTLQVRSDLAYGMLGDLASGIMDNEDLVIQVELLSVSDTANDPSVISDDQKVQKIEELKERATQEYRAQNYQEALNLFKEAYKVAKMLSQHTPETLEQRKLVL